MATQAANPLLSTSRASDTSPTIQLHPLVLLTISDSITRQTLRQLPGPVAGAILGQQNGQEITMEVAFQAKLVQNAEGEVVLDEEWFSKRVEDFKEVHKQPQLDLVGWYSLGPPSGPQPELLPIQHHISEVYTESPLLVLFHPSDALSEATAAGKLPLTIYEPVHESATGGNDKAMDIDGAMQQKELKFRELVYSVETGEAEMIAVDFVARGGGNATAVEAKSAAPKKSDDETKGKKGKGKQKVQPKEADEPIDDDKVLTAEDDEHLSTLTAKINAIKMLSRRITLLRAYLSSLPPSYLSSSSPSSSLPLNPTGPTPNTDPTQLPLDHSILRSISATLARINILSPPDTSAFTLESAQEASDVQLVALLSSITNSVAAAKDLGRKSAVVEGARADRERGKGFGPESGSGSSESGTGARRASESGLEERLSKALDAFALRGKE